MYLLFLGGGRTNTVAPPHGPGVVVAVRLCGLGVYFTIPTEERGSQGEGDLKAGRQVKVLSTESVTSFLLRICVNQRVRTDNVRCSEWVI